MVTDEIWSVAADAYFQIITVGMTFAHQERVESNYTSPVPLKCFNVSSHVPHSVWGSVNTFFPRAWRRRDRWITPIRQIWTTRNRFVNRPLFDSRFDATDGRTQLAITQFGRAACFCKIGKCERGGFGNSVTRPYISLMRPSSSSHNQRHSLQLFVVEFDTCLVWELLLLPSNAQTVPNLPSLKGNRWWH